MQSVTEAITKLMDEIGRKLNIPGTQIRIALDKIQKMVGDVWQDVSIMRDTLSSTLKRKQKLEGETLAMLKNYQEIRRLERELKEKQVHIGELNRQGQMMKKKVKHSRKIVESIHLEIEERKIQMSDLQRKLQTRLNSADSRFHAMMTIIPDVELCRSDTELTSEMSFVGQVGRIPGSPKIPTNPMEIVHENSYQRDFHNTNLQFNHRQADQAIERHGLRQQCRHFPCDPNCEQ